MDPEKTSKTMDLTAEIAAIENAIKRVGSNPQEMTFIVQTVIEEMKRVNGEALSLEMQINTLTARRAALDERITVVRNLAAKFGVTPPLPTEPPAV